MGFQLTPIVKYLLIINLVIFGLQVLVGIDFIEFGGLRYVFAEEFLPFQFITYMFIHGSFGHIFGNMFALFMFGPLLEQTLGSRRFFIFYMVTGIGAGVLNSGVNFIEMQSMERDVEAYIASPTPENFVHFLSDNEPNWHKIKEIVNVYENFDDNPKNQQMILKSQQIALELTVLRANAPTVGASGAIFGLLIAFALIFPNLELMLLFLPIPIKAKYLIAVYMVFEVYAGFTYGAHSGVAHFAHISGALIGFLFIRYWKIPRRN